jgi:hypothetical protein
MSPDRMRPRYVAGLRGAIGPVAADPVRQRLIVVDASSPIGVWSYRHGELPYESELRLPMGHGTIAVAGGHIWLGGYGELGAMLYRLDPQTLRPVAGGRASVFDPGAVLVAGGRDVIWVRNGDEVPGLLVCVNATSGRIEQRYHVLAEVPAVASTGGYAVLATAQGVLNLRLTRCTG